MTAAEFRRIRKALGLSARQMGLALGLRGDPGRTVRRYEAGTIEITGPTATAMTAMRDGFRPPWWPGEA
jgi:transcriptional regulator with XRE-family HTH domain